MAVQHHTIEANGVPLHVVEAGDPQEEPIIWMHGIWDRWLMWEAVTAQIPGHHFMVEFRGHGESGHPEGAEHYRWVDFADDIVALIDALRLPRVSLVGFSLGAIIATLVTAREPERVARAVAVDPPYHEGPVAVERFADLREVKNLPTDELVTFLAFMRPDRDEAEWRREAEWLHMTADGAFDAAISGTVGEQHLETVLPRIHQPFLILQADPKAGAALSDEMAAYALARMPQAQIVHFPGSSHTIAHDQPERFVTAVRDFLAASPAPA
jgi:3-oxoadipate enol-lactonase